MSAALTPTEQAVLALVRSLYAPGEPFRATDVYPLRTSQDAAGRRMLQRLLAKGALQSAAGVGEVPPWASGAYLWQEVA